jgi:tetratricopeptide (TPR) repeat protein
MKHALIAVCLLAVLALVAPPVGAQSSGAARGHVVDEDGQPVADATVVIEFQGGLTRKFEVKTNDRGEYMQVGLPIGTYRFTASKEGYAPSALDIKINMGLATDIPDLKLLSEEAASAKANPNKAKVKEMFTRGVELARDGKLDEAETVFNEILEIEPGVPEVHRNLGYIHAQRKEWAAAEADYKTAIDLRPGDADLVAALAQMYRDSGQEDKAVALMSQAAADNPQDAKTQLNEGIFLLSSGESEKAAKAFEAALAADPSMAEAHYHLGTILVGQGKVPEAIEHLEAYLASNPTNEQYAATAKGLLEALKQ